MLVLAISKYLDKLLQYCRLTTIATLGELRRVMVMTIHLPIMLIVTVLRAEYRRAHRACKMVYMVLLVQRRNI